MVTVVVARELIITGLRSYLESQGAVFGADWLGKLKMGLQCAALLAIFMALQSPDWLPSWTGVLAALRLALIYAMLLATLCSGLQYLWRAFALINAPRA
jgi:phosphatidylglycerophosphate synthase